jgi:drug/metabolite transporter (DMT)-like permease
MYCFALVVVLSIKPKAWLGLFQHPQLWLLCLASGLTNVGFNWAVSISDVVRVLILFYMMPAWAVLLAWLLLNERPTRAALIRLLLAFTGVMVVLLPSNTTSVAPSTLHFGFADGLALMGGFCFAFTNVLLKKLNDTPSESRMFAMFLGGAMLAFLAGTAGMLQGWVNAMPPISGDWVWLAVGLSLAFLMGNVALQFGASRLRSSTTSVVMLSEVAFGSLSAIALGAAVLDTRTLVGGLLIILAAAMAAFDN